MDIKSIIEMTSSPDYGERQRAECLLNTNQLHLTVFPIPRG